MPKRTILFFLGGVPLVHRELVPHWLQHWWSCLIVWITFSVTRKIVRRHILAVPLGVFTLWTFELMVLYETNNLKSLWSHLPSGPHWWSLWWVIENIPLCNFSRYSGIIVNLLHSHWSRFSINISPQQNKLNWNQLKQINFSNFILNTLQSLRMHLISFYKNISNTMRHKPLTIWSHPNIWCSIRNQQFYL